MIVKGRFSMTEFEKEKIYKEALSYLTSSLTNEETVEESLRMLESLGDYKDAEALRSKYTELYRIHREEKASLAKRRRIMVILQRILVALGLALIGSLIFILVYALRLW